MKRSCGVLLPVSALPGPYGIGTLGSAAYEFVDFLADAGQTWWQMLPVGPTSYGDSPYQSFSTYAGNPYFVDLELLIRDGLLTEAECQAPFWGADASEVDYAAVYAARFEVLRLAKERGWDRDQAQVAAFRRENQSWLEEYALYMAIKRENCMHSWLEWPESLRRREPEALEAARARLRADRELFIYIQYLFEKQWEALRAYAHEKGVLLFGDLPIYVALDSADVWAEPEQFQLTEEGLPSGVAGVPPDYFSETGQLWGNPLYDWAKMRRDGYNWWIRRLDGIAKRFDMVRIDHFRGFAEYWNVPYAAQTAAEGHWEKGPGEDFVKTILGWFPNLGVVAEDLGVESPALTHLMETSGLPGMRVLQFAFDERKENPYQPHCYPENCVCYTGTHDNDTLLGWAAGAQGSALAFVREYLGAAPGEGLCWTMLRGGMRSVAVLFVAPMQDYLELGAEARMNTPGTLGGNWSWRLSESALTQALARRMRFLAGTYGRLPKTEEDL